MKYWVRITSQHNLSFYIRIMSDIRDAIKKDNFKISQIYFYKNMKIKICKLFK